MLSTLTGRKEFQHSPLPSPGIYQDYCWTSHKVKFSSIFVIHQQQNQLQFLKKPCLPESGRFQLPLQLLTDRKQTHWPDWSAAISVWRQCRSPCMKIFIYVLKWFQSTGKLPTLQALESFFTQKANHVCTIGPVIAHHTDSLLHACKESKDSYKVQHLQSWKRLRTFHSSFPFDCHF